MSKAPTTETERLDNISYLFEFAFINSFELKGVYADSLLMQCAQQGS